MHSRRPVWLVENLGLDRIRAEAERMEEEAGQFYVRAAQASTDADTPPHLRAEPEGQVLVTGEFPTQIMGVPAGHC